MRLKQKWNRVTLWLNVGHTIERSQVWLPAVLMLQNNI